MATETPHIGNRTLDLKLAAAVAVVSVLTMPLTAIWFLFLGFATLACSAVYAGVAKAPHRTRSRLQAGGSIAIGLLAGPIIYLTLAVLT